MTNLITRRFIFIVLSLSAWASPMLHAHLLHKQQGNLNIVENDGVYLAVSIPVSAFKGIDDDKNGLVSMIEFNKHRVTIVNRVKASIVLSEKEEDRLLQGVMLSPVPVDEHSKNIDSPVARIYVMGKFILSQSNSDLYFRNTLYGTQPSEQIFKMSVKRKSDGKTQTFKLTPKAPNVKLFI